MSNTLEAVSAFALRPRAYLLPSVLDIPQDPGAEYSEERDLAEEISTNPPAAQNVSKLDGTENVGNCADFRGPKHSNASRGVETWMT